ncbi:type II secretion system protein GspK [Paucibacter sp. PLA-PC-4]|uniref:general secretion pathway protein GspK n=1 Tax=Paucibacter sp. PLA-PC-4 TaxID=2993655 RepID=UPI00224B78BA|nr:type II secretion system protein GspK [Paucibacter sp. PLA-PC-4]MCX2865117.1 type II secretion system protein GspK [Paucibacter sp. PLA-PC-4]
MLFVTVALTVVALVAARFALRIDGLREQAQTLQAYADARLVANSARAQALYWLSTRPIGHASAGFVDEQPLALDGRRLRTEEGAIVRVQDERGLLSLNTLDRDGLGNVLISLGARADQLSSLMDVLEDYADSDSLRRLNGAEAQDYSALGLPPPRNDWLLSVDELGRMPIWQSEPALRSKLLPWVGVRRDKLFNPNTAPLELLKSIWPKVSLEQWGLFETLRKNSPFVDAASATAATGIPFVGDQLLFHGSNVLRLQVWASGLPQALEYNLLILPTGAAAPWLIREIRQTDRLDPAHATSAVASPVAKFPVPSSTVAGPRSPAQPTP